MEKPDILHSIRGLGFVAGVLQRQCREPLCSNCISYALTVERTRGALNEIKAALKGNDIAEGFAPVFEEASSIILKVPVPADPAKQRKEGKCHFPGKACLIKKAARMFLFTEEKEQD